MEEAEAITEELVKENEAKVQQSGEA